MDFATVVLVLVVYLLRLHQLIPGGELLFSQKYLMVASVASMAFRGRGFAWRDLVRTPLDWAMVLYCGFIVFHEDEHWETFKEVIKLFFFYAVTVQALCNSRRLFVFMSFWAGCIAVLALVTLDSAFGIDFTDSQSLLPLYDDRYCLNLSVYNNPNALGHTLALGIPMFYYAFFSMRGMGMKVLSIVMWGMVAVAIYLTESKGAFLVGGGLACLPFWVGRKWIIRILLIVFIAGVGIGAIQYLPRMEAIQSAGAVASDEGIWGRLAVWNVAMEDLQADGSGVGWKKFYPLISYTDPLGKTVFFQKGPHNSYVAVAAELGYAGLFMYLLVLAVCLRVVMQFGTLSQDQKRAKVLLLIVVLGYCISGWLIERPYHIEYFFFAGACAAFQRQRLHGELQKNENATEGVNEPAHEKESEVATSPLLLGGRASSLLQTGQELTHQFAETRRAASFWLQPVVAGASPRISQLASVSQAPDRSELDAENAPPNAQDDIFKPMRWRRISLVELAISFIALFGVLEIWKWVLNRFFL